MSSPFGPPSDATDKPSAELLGNIRANQEFDAAQRVSGWLFLALVAMGCIGVNLAVPSLLDHLDDSVISGFLLGCTIAQVNLIAIWGVMATGRILLRMPWAFALLTIMWYSLVIGCYIDNQRGYRMEEAIQLGMILFISLPLAMAPLGLMAWVLKWKLTRPLKGNVREQMSIGLLLGGITLVGALFGLGKVILPDSPVRFAALQGELYFLLAAVVFYNLVQTTPAIWITFFPWEMMGFATIGMVIYAAILSIAEIFTISMFLGMPPDFWEIAMVFTAMNVGQVLTVVAVLACLRLLGFQLKRQDHIYDSPFAELPQPILKTLDDRPADYQPAGYRPAEATSVDELFRNMDI